ncbi:GlsB/YeaQ/YmgE family stress response membrane protein [Rothia nasimurium]|uniref:GlsB/YeaQ/YmgE family stress response membrane protein n=1 Tax=Rothia nasimurium TaxID=85336 RepID=UPI002DD64F40|nr:GlsB/YeaQ/YmgE family stress response membrane protein [Rothia nasimurium]
MSIFGWIIIGLLAGAIAKLIMPGKQGGGILVTMVLGIVGAMLGGWLGSFLPFLSDGMSSGVGIGTLFTAVVGSLLVLWIYGAITKNKA